MMITTTASKLSPRLRQRHHVFAKLLRVKLCLSSGGSFLSLLHGLLLMFTLTIVSASVSPSTAFLKRAVHPSLMLPIEPSRPATLDDHQIFVPCGGRLNQQERAITVSHPASLDPTDRFFVIGSFSYQALALMVDHINTQRCGVVVEGEHYALILQTMGDNSNGAKHEAIGRYLVNRTDFFLGGYTSVLTQFLAPVTQESGKLMVAGGSSRGSIFQNRDLVFGTLPPARRYFEASLEVVTMKGAKSLAIIQEEGTAACNPLIGVAKLYGMDPVELIKVPARPPLELLAEVAYNLSKTGDTRRPPDVVISCLIGTRCPAWVQALRLVRWTPQAQIFGICGALELQQNRQDLFYSSTDVENAVWYEEDLAHMMVASSWTRVLPTPPDAVTGWNPEEFAVAFEEFASIVPPFQVAAAATALSVLVQAIERANSLDTEQVRNIMATESFPTVFGTVAFDQNGQNNAESLLLQFNGDLELNVVHPSFGGRTASNMPNRTESSSPTSIFYPLPSWDNRDCEHRSLCLVTMGVCSLDGRCLCDDAANPLSTVPSFLPRLSLGVGPTARCRQAPDEDFSFVSDSLLHMGLSFMTIQFAASVGCIVWTLRNYKVPIVKTSQPFFLVLVAIGSIVLVSSIVPLSYQGEYRYKRDITTWELTSIENPDINELDMACMAFPWLVGLGFALIFAALFAKIWRIRMLLRNAEMLWHLNVQIKDVLFIILIMILIECSILLAWQLISPLQWERIILRLDVDGFPVQSLGKCTSDFGSAFYGAWGVVNGFCLLYALWLSYATRHVAEDLSKSRWITISVGFIFQVLVLAVPVLIIADENQGALYILEVMVVFSVSASATLFIFAPLMWRLHHEGHTNLMSDRQQNNFGRLVARSSQQFCINTAAATFPVAKTRHVSSSPPRQKQSGLRDSWAAMDLSIVELEEPQEMPLSKKKIPRRQVDSWAAMDLSLAEVQKQENDISPMPMSVIEEEEATEGIIDEEGGALDNDVMDEGDSSVQNQSRPIQPEPTRENYKMDTADSSASG